MQLVGNVVIVKEVFQPLDFFNEVVSAHSFAVLSYSKFQILWAIIVRLAIYVMDSLGWKKWPIEFSRHYKTVLKNSKASTIAITLPHLGEKLSLILRETAHCYGNISTTRYNSFVLAIFDVSRICQGRTIQSIMASNAISGKGFSFDRAPSDHAGITTVSASHSKRYGVSVINNLPVVPVYDCSFRKIKSIDWFGVWCSTGHLLAPIFFIAIAGFLIISEFARNGGG